MGKKEEVSIFSEIARTLLMAVEGLDSKSEREERPRDLNTGTERKTRRRHEKGRSSMT